MMEKVNEIKAEQVVMYLASKYDTGWSFEKLEPATFWRMYEGAHVPFNMKPIAYLNDEVEPLRFPLPVNRDEVVENIFYDEILPGLRAMGCSIEDPSKIVEELKEAVEKLPPEARIVRTIRNRLRTIIGDVEGLNWGRIGEKAGRQYWVRITWALEAFLKLGSHSFDAGSCFRSSGSNWYHRYTLAASSGSFVGYILKQSENCGSDEQKFSRIGRFWGFVDRYSKSVVFSNFYGVNALQNDESAVFVAQKIADYLGLGFRPEHIVVASVYIGVYTNGDHVVISADKNTAYVESLWTCPHCGEERCNYLLEHSCFEDDGEEPFYCENCGVELGEDNIIWMGNYPYCRDCVGYCDYCGELELRRRMYRVGDEEWCDYCYVNHAARCETCDFVVNRDYAEDYMHVVKLYLVCSLGRFYYREPEKVYICGNCYRKLSSCSRCNRKSLELVLLTSLSDVIDGRIPEEKICVECYFGLGFDRRHGSAFCKLRTGEIDPSSKSYFFVPVNYSGGNE